MDKNHDSPIFFQPKGGPQYQNGMPETADEYYKRIGGPAPAVQNTHPDSNKNLADKYSIPADSIVRGSGAGDTATSRLLTPDSIAATLNERGSRYGRFAVQAQIGYNLRQTMHKCPGWLVLPPHQQEALDTICSKIARILNGDPTYLDNWHDIAGYATLVEKILKGENP